MQRDAFIAWARNFLQASDGFFNTRELARIGSASGALTADEAARMEGHSIMPPWFVEGFTSGTTKNPSSSAQPRVTVAGNTLTYKEAIPLGQTISPPVFDHRRGSSPAVKVFSGHGGTFILQNFMKATFLDDGYIPELTDLRNSWAWPLFCARSPTRLTGRTFVCVVEGSAVFSHWLFDTLPRFELARIFGYPYSKIDNFVVATSHTNFHREAMSVFGVDNSKILTRVEIGPVLFCDEFVAVSDVRHAFFAENWLYELIQDRFIPNLRVAEPWRRIFISRSKASRRRLINESELYSILDKWNFSVIHAEELTITETAKLLLEASHIVAPHGAGLANVAFANDKAKVLEIYGAHISTEFWKICATRGLGYYCLQANDVQGKPFAEDLLNKMGFFDRNATDMHLAVSEFDAAMASFMA
jgi:capsular polysaccharide biosynthesis protein